MSKKCALCKTVNLSYSYKLRFFLLIVNLANSADPDEMPHYVAFYLGLHCLQKNAFRSSSTKMVNKYTCEQNKKCFIQNCEPDLLY